METRSACSVGTKECMLRQMFLRFVLSITTLSLLLPAVAAGASDHGKRHIYHWHGYGFLPGYHQPPSNSVPIYSRYSRKPSDRVTTSYPNFRTPSYWWGGGHYYFGDPGFYRGRYNGGSVGPCWTWTPIGPMWNCG
jgi:hypothetical protein